MKRLLVMLLILVIIPVSGQFTNPKIVNIKAVAVKTGGERDGVVINVTVIVTGGNGKVFVSTSPYTEIDMQGSAQLSALTACDLLGLDFTKYDFFYEIKADAPIVGGPSAGAVMTIATLCALKNLSLRDDVFMTGMIYPDGYIGPVGGIPYKLKAAARDGAKIFLIPKGQRICYVTEVYEEKRGPFVFIRHVTKPVDVVELGKSLGVDVVEVENVNQALWYYTGCTISKPKLGVSLAKYSDILKFLAIEMKNETMKLRDEVGYVKEAEDLIRKAEEDFEKGYYYTATSEFFQAKIKLRRQYYSNILRSDEDLERAFDEVEMEIEDLKRYLKNLSVGVESLQIVGAGEERVAWAEKFLSDARTSGNWYKAIEYLALSKERVESAKVWLSLLQMIKQDIPIDRDVLKKRSEFYFRIAQSLIVYANSINGYGSLINSAGESLDIAQNLLNEGFYAGSQIACIDSMVKSGLAVEIITPNGSFEEILNSKLESSKTSAETSIAESEEVITPILPIAYFEFATSYLEDYRSNGDIMNAVSALIYYKLSERLSKLMLFISKAYEERELVKTEIPPFTPSESKVFKKRFEHVEIVPGYTAITVLAVVALVCYKRKKSRGQG